jgi:hypothetical protein
MTQAWGNGWCDAPFTFRLLMQSNNIQHHGTCSVSARVSSTVVPTSPAFVAAVAFYLQKTSIHAGVTWDKRASMWIATMHDGRRGVQLGSFAAEAEAVRILAQARIDMADAAESCGSGLTELAVDEAPPRRRLTPGRGFLTGK